MQIGTTTYNWTNFITIPISICQLQELNWDMLYGSTTYNGSSNFKLSQLIAMQETNVHSNCSQLHQIL